MPKLKEKTAAPAIPSLQPKGTVPATAAELQSLQRRRAVVLKSRNMVANRLQALVAGTIGYHSGMPEKERKKKFAEAATVVRQVADGADSDWRGIILAHLASIKPFNVEKAALEKEMLKLARCLPVAAWVLQPEQNGFGLPFLAIVIGETGDLANYPNPAKVWRRLGCAPHTFGGQTHMGATWRAGKEGKLPAEEWEAFGYSPRRRSIAYLIGEAVMKQNFVRGGNGDSRGATESTIATRRTKSAGANGTGDGGIETEGIDAGPYRARYDQAKAAARQNHPDWPPQRCNLHGKLLAAKLLLKRLWVEWNRGDMNAFSRPHAADAAGCGT